MKYKVLLVIFVCKSFKIANMNHQLTEMYFKTKKISLIILGATALAFSRILFFLFDDPEGPNLLIVSIFALAIYLFSVGIYLFAPSQIKSVKRISAVIVIQILTITMLYLFMK
ncbi:hypothetical protein GCM10027049_23470 [Mucilaginibacter puniceus]